MLRVLILYKSGVTYSLNSTPNFFIAIFFSPTIFNRNLLRGSRRKNIFSYFVLICWRSLSWDLNQGLKSNKPTHYLLDYSDIIQTRDRNFRSATYCGTDEKLVGNWQVFLWLFWLQFSIALHFRAKYKILAAIIHRPKKPKILFLEMVYLNCSLRM